VIDVKRGPYLRVACRTIGISFMQRFTSVDMAGAPGLLAR
jgi:hypothetical protein